MQIFIQVANVSKKLISLSNGMLIGVESDLPELIVRLDHTEIISLEEKKNEDESVVNNVAAVPYKEK